MSETELPLGTIHTCLGVRRAADAMVRALGGAQITLRIADASAGDTNSQLGLTPPTSEDVQISPALVRTIAPSANGSKRIEVTLSAKAVKPLADQYGVDDVPTWLLTAEGVLFFGKLMRIDTVISDHLGGMDYLYHIVATE
ncbi:MAG: hypothetical protein WCC92_02315 [Candidatus Korobacteraceae bacterium]